MRIFAQRIHDRLLPCRSCGQTADAPRRGFTLVELVVLLAVVAVLLALALPGFASARGQSRQTQCAANLRQLAIAELAYGNDNGDRLHSWSGPGNWLWDTPQSVTDTLARYGAQRRQFYCPANPEQNADGLWNYSLPFYRVIGYSLALNGAPSLIATNANLTATPQQTFLGLVVTPAQPAAQRVFMADVIMTQLGQNSAAQKLTYTYVNIFGGFSAPGWTGHRTSHLDINARYPAGANLGMLDGHVEWRKFGDVIPRTVGGVSPGFWW